MARVRPFHKSENALVAGKGTCSLLCARDGSKLNRLIRPRIHYGGRCVAVSNAGFCSHSCGLGDAVHCNCRSQSGFFLGAVACRSCSRCHLSPCQDVALSGPFFTRLDPTGQMFSSIREGRLKIESIDPSSNSLWWQVRCS